MKLTIDTQADKAELSKVIKFLQHIMDEQPHSEVAQQTESFTPMFGAFDAPSEPEEGQAPALNELLNASHEEPEQKEEPSDHVEIVRW